MRTIAQPRDTASVFFVAVRAGHRRRPGRSMISKLAGFDETMRPKCPERNRDCVRTGFAPGRPPPVLPRLTGACAAMRGSQICVRGQAQCKGTPSAWPARRPSSRCQTARCAICPRSTSLSRDAFLRPGWSLSIRARPEEGWAERRQAHYFICRVSETRRVRTQRGAARPMTRDARLSALHRGDFRPGAALPSPAFPPDPYSDAPRSQVVMPGGRCPGPPEPAVTSRGRRTPLPAPPSGSSLEDAPP
jgi:hypothetical protein